ncbi:bifunctional DNA primase/polymerase [Corynebacterium sp. H127]|uniref:bifunctional DNA primase/polymerase n=1 Tax=Corynebacterium sp. H127 TaxID=3133418 RepID=UPI0030ADA798
MNDSSTIQYAVNLYKKRGWLEVLPLKQGEKNPPLVPRGQGWFGNSPAKTKEQTLELMAGHEGNLALRMPDNVMCLDVDLHDKTKNGPATLALLEDELGKLPEGPYSTRHGAGNDQRHVFYRVESGVKWASTAGPGIDLRQHTVSYCVAWPSTYKETAYKWYAADHRKLDVPPCVSELPELPTAWQKHLKAGLAKDSLKRGPSEDLYLDTALEWLETVAPGYSEEPAEHMSMKAKEFAEAMDNDAHGSLLKAQRWALRRGALEGEKGVKQILDFLREAFARARASRSRDEHVHAEFDRALAGEINNLRGDVEHGKARLYVEKFGSFDPKELTNLDGAACAEERAGELIEAAAYLVANYQGDKLRARLFALANEGVIVVQGKSSNMDVKQWLYDTYTGELVSVGAALEMSDNVTPLLKSLLSALDSEDEDDRAEVKFLNGVLNQLSTTAGARNMIEPLKGYLKAEGRFRFADEFDANPHVLLLRDGQILDLKQAEKGKPLSECVRPRSVQDLLSGDFVMGLSGSDIARFAGSGSTKIADLLELIYPDTEVRGWVYRALAYGLLGDNPHRLFWGLLGETATGKGTTTTAYTRLLGSYAAPVSMADLTQNGGNNSALAKALKARFAYMAELSAKTKGDANVLKSISGNDRMTVTDKFRASEDVKSGVTLFFETNHVPHIPGADRALRDRLMVVPMEGDREQIQAWLKQSNNVHLKPEALVGFLAELIQVYPEALCDGFRDGDMPERMRELADQFIASADEVGQWVGDRFELAPEGKLANSELRTALETAIVYKELEPTVSISDLTSALIDLGARRTKSPSIRAGSKKERGVLGVKLKAAA